MTLRMPSHPPQRTLKLDVSLARLAENLFPTETSAPEPLPPSIGMPTSPDGDPPLLASFPIPLILSPAPPPPLLLLPRSPPSHIHPPLAPLWNPFLPGLLLQSTDGPSVQKRNASNTFVQTLTLLSLNLTVSSVLPVTSGFASAQILLIVLSHGMLTARAA
jgi:hypothetical protein